MPVGSGFGFRIVWAHLNQITKNIVQCNIDKSNWPKKIHLSLDLYVLSDNDFFIVIYKLFSKLLLIVII